MWIRITALVATLLATTLTTTGCFVVTDDVPSSNVLRLDVGDSHARHTLTFDAQGLALVDSAHSIELPTASEKLRFGIKLADVSALPPEWRPQVASDGGVLVAQLRDTSPLALAGLLPGDRVLAINDQGVGSPADAVRILESVPDDGRVKLLVQKPETVRSVEETLVIETTVAGGVSDSHHLGLIVADAAWAENGGGFIAPVRVVAYRDYSHATSEGVERSVEWGFGVIDLLHYNRTETTRLGKPVKSASKLKLLWLIPIYTSSTPEEKS